MTSPRRAPFTLMAISDLASTESPQRWLEALVAAGIPSVQLREKRLGDRDRLDLARDFRRVLPSGEAPAASTRTQLMINGRVDIAIAGRADGVHLPATGLPVPALRKFFPHLIYGRSTHSVSEVEAAAAEGADYVTLGPIFDTPSKRAYGAPVGLATLAEASRLGVPILALGGIVSCDQFHSLAAHGASGVAAIRLFQLDKDLEEVRIAAEEAFGS
ncbi:MAG: thiamine phosphate synthase [Thermoanaerobaculia bacterium]|nr:thiamine phosphate synthase [Thermoanaerobaculia bacterium]